MSYVLSSPTLKQARNCEFCLPLVFRFSNPFRRIITRSFITIRPPTPFYSPLRPPRRIVRQPVDIWSEELRKINARPRGIHCSFRTQVAPFVWIAGILKTSTSLGVPHFLGRIALSFFPVVMIKRRMMSILLKVPEETRHQLLKLVGRRGGMDLAMRLRATNIYLAVAFLTPLVLFAVIIIAGLERTPLTGRVRLILLSPEEEAEISNDLARDGWTRDVLNILASSNSGAPPRLIPPHDWRWRWVERTLRRLEAAVPILLDDKGYKALYERQINQPFLMPPPLDYPLEARPHIQPKPTGADSPSAPEQPAPTSPALGPPYALLVVENPEPNAFSYGFGGNGGGGVVVYTGFVDEVLADTPPPPPPAPSAPSGRLASLFTIKPTPQPRPDPVPTVDQTTQLATLLSHELSHLLLSHHLETLSFGTVLIPRVNAILADFLRVVLFPCTIMLGPWFGDAINNMSRVGLGEITQSGVACASRKLEIEADVISARLLALAGFDPGAAVSFWESRLSILPTDLDSSPPQPPSTSDPSDTSPSRFLKAPNSMRSTHPIDEKRVMMLEQELERWKKFKEKLLAKRQAAITS